MSRSLKRAAILTGIMLILTLVAVPVDRARAQESPAVNTGRDIEIWETKGDVTKIEGNVIYINKSPYLVNDQTKFYSAEDESIIFDDIKEINVVNVKYYFNDRSAENQRPILVEVRVSRPL